MRIHFICAVMLLVLATSGCCFRGGYPTGYYAPGPSVVPQQPSTGFPGGPFYQPGGAYPYPTNGGTPYVPGTSPSGPTLMPPGNSGGSTTYESPSGGAGSAPTFNPETPAGDKVPLPGDDPGFDRGSAKPKLTPTTSALEPQDPPSMVQKESRPRPRPSVDANANLPEADDPFEAPSVRQASATDTTDDDVQFADSQPALTRGTPKPYAHDPEWNWIQGIVDYDPESKTWMIMYDDTPDKADQLGGVMTLVDHPALTKLRTGDAVRIEGTVDENVGDSRNMPVFRIARAKKL
ncbi:MAG: hypothetical protein WCH39_07855 [Schlesneria sp.]